MKLPFILLLFSLQASIANICDNSYEKSYLAQSGSDYNSLVEDAESLDMFETDFQNAFNEVYKSELEEIDKILDLDEKGNRLQKLREKFVTSFPSAVKRYNEQVKGWLEYHGFSFKEVISITTNYELAGIEKTDGDLNEGIHIFKQRYPDVTIHFNPVLNFLNGWRGAFNPMYDLIYINHTDLIAWTQNKIGSTFLHEYRHMYQNLMKSQHQVLTGYNQTYLIGYLAPNTEIYNKFLSLEELVNTPRDLKTILWYNLLPETRILIRKYNREKVLSDSLMQSQVFVSTKLLKKFKQKVLANKAIIERAKLVYNLFLSDSELKKIGLKKKFVHNIANKELSVTYTPLGDSSKAFKITMQMFENTLPRFSPLYLLPEWPLILLRRKMKNFQSQLEKLIQDIDKVENAYNNFKVKQNHMNLIELYNSLEPFNGKLPAF